MTTTDAPSVIETLAALSRLDRAITRVCADDATLTDVRSLLDVLTKADPPVDPIRTQGLLTLANRALGRFSGHVLYAPPAALNDLVADAVGPCKAAHLGCINDVALWDGDWCSRSCEVEDQGTRP